MKIASWNVNSLNVRMPHLEQWLRETQPDVVALQETKLEDSRFPDTALAALGYRSVFAGQKSYNGVAILARAHALEDVQVGIPGFEDAQQRVIAATVNGVRVVNFYVVNGQAVGSEKFEYKMRWLDAARAMLAEELAIRNSWCSATSTSRRPTSTCITPSAGTRRSCARRPSAMRSAR